MHNSLLDEGLYDEQFGTTLSSYSSQKSVKSVYVQVNVCFLCFGCILVFSTLVAQFVLIHKFVGRHEEYRQYPVTGLPISREYLAEEE